MCTVDMRMSTQNTYPFVSIIICSLNGAAYIADCLRSIQSQTYPADKREVIVIDDGSIDETSSIARSFDGVRVIRFEENKGIPIARNAGLNAAQGDLIAYIDSDCVAEPQWLEQVVPAFSDPTIVAAGGKVLAFSRATISQRYMEATGYGNPARNSPQKGILGRLIGYGLTMVYPTILETKAIDVQAVYTANVVYRGTVIRAIGGFDEHLQTSEDSDVAARLRTQGGRIVYIPNAIVRHRHYETLAKVVGEPYKRVSHAVKFYAKTRALPAVFPMPVLYITMLIVALMCIGYIRLIGFTILALVLPLFLYGWWLIRLVREGRVEYLLYCYIQCVVECLVTYALVYGFVTLNKQDTHLNNLNKKNT